MREQRIARHFSSVREHCHLILPRSRNLHWQMVNGSKTASCFPEASNQFMIWWHACADHHFSRLPFQRLANRVLRVLYIAYLGFYAVFTLPFVGSSKMLTL